LVDRWHGVLNAGKPPGEKEANRDVGVGIGAYVKDEERGPKGLDSSAGANGDGALSFVEYE
jgi:hypothetical protein